MILNALNSDLEFLMTCLGTELASWNDTPIRDYKKNQQLIYHYTTLEGFVGIINSQSFYASNASFLNDKSELIYGKEITEKLLRSIIEKKGFNRVCYFGFNNKEENLLMKTIEELNKPIHNNIYITCFSTKPDLLSQWRGYGNGGVRIGFSPLSLNDSLKNRVYLTWISYNIEKQLKCLEEIISTCLDYVLNKEPEVIEQRKIDELFPKALALMLLQTNFGFKDKSFKEEQERRLIYDPLYNLRLGESNFPNIKFRSNGKYIIPYVELFSNKLPIKNVMVGPSSYQERIVDAIKLMLEESEYSNVPVLKSKIPFVN